MANTTQDKLALLLRTKSNIKNAIILNGVSVPADTPFSGYPDLIDLIADQPETTTVNDLMEMCDLYEDLYNGKYVEHTYTQTEQDNLVNLVDSIIGEEEVIVNE